jgi:protein-disulfide isomerase
MTDDPTPEAAPAETASAPATGGGGRATLLAWAGPTLGALALVVAVTGQLGFEDRVRGWLLANPGILDEMVQARQLQQAELGAAETDRRIAADPSLVAVDPRDPAFGPADAEVTVIEYADFQCPGCKAVAPEFLALMQRHPEVRFVFRDWAILDRAPGGTSDYAARAALAAHRQGRYLPVYQALLAEPALSPERVDEILAAAGVDLARARADMDSAAIRQQVADIDANARALALQGTPTFIVDGRATRSIQPSAIDAAIQAAKARQ